MRRRQEHVLRRISDTLACPAKMVQPHSLSMAPQEHSYDEGMSVYTELREELEKHEFSMPNPRPTIEPRKTARNGVTVAVRSPF